MEGVPLPVLVGIDVNVQGPSLEGVPVSGHHLEPGLACGVWYAVQEAGLVILAVVVTQPQRQTRLIELHGTVPASTL